MIGEQCELTAPDVQHVDWARGRELAITPQEQLVSRSIARVVLRRAEGKLRIADERRVRPIERLAVPGPRHWSSDRPRCVPALRRAAGARAESPRRDQPEIPSDF